MLLTILFVLFMILALVSHLPGDRLPPGVILPGGLFLWLAVVVLYLMGHSLHLGA